MKFFCLMYTRRGVGGYSLKQQRETKTSSNQFLYHHSRTSIAHGAIIVVVIEMSDACMKDLCTFGRYGMNFNVLVQYSRSSVGR